MTTHPAVSTPKQSDFLAVPESPLVYWLSESSFGLFLSHGDPRNERLLPRLDPETEPCPTITAYSMIPRRRSRQ